MCRMFPFILIVVACGYTSVTMAFQPNKSVARSSSLGSSASPLTSGEKRKAIVVGGGPVGLATALTLSNPPHCFDVTLLEQAKNAATYDPTKAFLYLVNARGQVWTRNFPSVQKMLQERGSSNLRFSITIVPADPSIPVPTPKNASVADQEILQKSYWIPRHAMVQLLEDAISEQEQASSSRTSDPIGSIQIITGKSCQSVETTEDGLLQVTVQDTSSPDVRYQESYTANLVVGADGMYSAVRECLADDVTKPLKTNWLTGQPQKFRLKQWTSPASGLRMKVLQFPSAFQIPNPDGTRIVTHGESTYAIRSIHTGPLNYLSLGLLPVKDPNMARPTNVIARPNHDIWKLKSAQEIKQWFAKAFPRMNLEEMVPDSEWERFAQAQGTIFSKCQYCPGLQVSSLDGKAGVVLVGDAIHAFPPDIGQGINAGLGDVVALDRALRGQDILTGDTKDEHDTIPELGDALKEYERVRGPEVQSLIRLARFGAPYQYKQPLRKDRVGRFLWTVNVAGRAMLNKLSRGIIPPAAIMMAQKKDLTFRQVMRRADLTTSVLVSAFVGILWTMLRRLVKV